MHLQLISFSIVVFSMFSHAQNAPNSPQSVVPTQQPVIDAKVLPMPKDWKIYENLAQQSLNSKRLKTAYSPLPNDRLKTNQGVLQTGIVTAKPLLQNDFLKLPYERPRGQRPDQTSALVIPPSTVLQANFIVEADYALYQLLGSNEAAVRAYVANLLATISGIYETDVKVRIQASQVRVWTKPDPWANSSSAHTTLYNLQSFWQRYHHEVPRAGVILLSARAIGGAGGVG